MSGILAFLQNVDGPVIRVPIDAPAANTTGVIGSFKVMTRLLLAPEESVEFQIE